MKVNNLYLRMEQDAYEQLGYFEKQQLHVVDEALEALGLQGSVRYRQGWDAVCIDVEPIRGPFGELMDGAEIDLEAAVEDLIRIDGAVVLEESSHEEEYAHYEFLVTEVSYKLDIQGINFELVYIYE